VYSAVTPAALAQPELLYRKLGAKLVVGMPFKDIATSGERAACGHQGLGVWG
jgi:(E)-4-hydroxy-3-methylbut-2-enyl-diphosphate synthase